MPDASVQQRQDLTSLSAHVTHYEGKLEVVVHAYRGPAYCVDPVPVFHATVDVNDLVACTLADQMRFAIRDALTLCRNRLNQA